MTTYPLTFPDVGVKSSTFGLMSSSIADKSPFTGQGKSYDYGGQWWEGQVTFKPVRRVDAALIQSFVAKLRGQFGTFNYGDPDALTLGFQGAGGTILVKGASQTGNNLIVDGMTPSTTIAKAGDYFQLGTGTSARLYMFTQDLVSDGSGDGTAVFEPDLRSSPADNTQLDITAPVGTFRLVNSDFMWSSNETSIYQMSLTFREAF